MTTFKVGEIVIGQNFVRDTYCNGLEIEILEGPFNSPETPCRAADGEMFIGTFYRVLIAAHAEDELLPAYHLRKKRPPESDDSAARQAMLDCIERAKMPQVVNA